MPNLKTELRGKLNYPVLLPWKEPGSAITPQLFILPFNSIMISMKADPSHSNWTIFGYFSVRTGNGFQISQGSFFGVRFMVTISYRK
jgi:hypothetical protein